MSIQVVGLANVLILIVQVYVICTHLKLWVAIAKKQFQVGLNLNYIIEHFKV